MFRYYVIMSFFLTIKYHLILKDSEIVDEKIVNYLLNKTMYCDGIFLKVTLKEMQSYYFSHILIL